MTVRAAIEGQRAVQVIYLENELKQSPHSPALKAITRQLSSTNRTISPAQSRQEPRDESGRPVQDVRLAACALDVSEC